MDSEHMWKATAIVLCAAVPAGFYVLGDLTYAFPGVLTIEPEETEPAAGPPAQAESWDRAPGEVPTGAVATSPRSEERRVGTEWRSRRSPGHDSDSGTRSAGQ